MASPTIIGGIPIPSSDPLFLAILAVHAPAGLVCVVAGAVAMLATKRPGLHPRAGSIYYWSLLVVSVTTTLLSAMRWSEDYHLFLFGAAAFAAASFGRTARRRRRPGWPRRHVAAMGASYILLLTAFYVDNGKNLPVWRDLTTIAYWIAPALFGIPLIAWALLRHPVVTAKDDQA